MSEKDEDQHGATGEPDLTQESAPFLIYGVLTGISGLLSFIPLVASGDFDGDLLLFSLLIVIAGAILVTLAFGIRNRWRYTLVLLLPVCLLGLFHFPIGTLVCGYILLELWKIRTRFYPFDQSRDP